MGIRVLLVDRHMLMLVGLRLALAASPDIDVVGETTSGRAVVPLVTRLHPDVVLVDLRMSEIDGLTLLETIRRQFPRVKVIVTSTTTEPEQIEAALQRGANGFVVKTMDPSDLPSAVREAFEGTVYHAIGVADPARVAATTAGLTEQQLTILRGVARGRTNEAIARELWVTEQTIKYHLTNIYRKLGVANRTEATRYAYTHGLVASPTEERR